MTDPVKDHAREAVERVTGMVDRFAWDQAVLRLDEAITELETFVRYERRAQRFRRLRAWMRRVLLASK